MTAESPVPREPKSQRKKKKEQRTKNQRKKENSPLLNRIMRLEGSLKQDKEEEDLIKKYNRGYFQGYFSI